MKILCKFPTRGRWDKFSDTFYKYQTLRTTNDIHFLVTIDQDDNNMNRPMIVNNFTQWGNVSVNFIRPSGKIGAINAGVDDLIDEYDIILLASDDMIPIVRGYDQIIIDAMKHHWPDTDGILFYDDGFQGNRLNTLCILGRKYYKRFGYIYHPSYKALWCDNEFMDVGYMLKRQVFIDRCIIRHEHPVNTKNKNSIDGMNVRDNNFMGYDQNNYNVRKQRNFDLTFDIDTYTNVPAGDVQQNDGGTQPANRRGRPRKKG
jgi:hypothetical protein